MSSKSLRSPLFYVGDKYKLIQEIKGYFPNKISKFIEPFAGGGSVFMNIEAESYHLNDIDSYVYSLHNFLLEQSSDPDGFFQQIEEKILAYGLSRSYKEDIVPEELKQAWKKTYYAKFNKDSFQKLKSDYNASDRTDVSLLYILLIYGFNRMIRFNSKGNYNLPVGNVDFNKNVIVALNNYFTLSRQRDVTWYNKDYQEFLGDIEVTKDDFVYFDPPYLITFSEYNKLWNDQKELEFVNFLTDLNSQGKKFAVSNVVVYKTKENCIFNDWAKNYNIYPIKSNYISYHDNSIKKFEEILVTNYDHTQI